MCQYWCRWADDSYLIHKHTTKRAVVRCPALSEHVHCVCQCRLPTHQSSCCEPSCGGQVKGVTFKGSWTPQSLWWLLFSWLSVPVESIVWKDSSLKWPVLCVEWDVKPYTLAVWHREACLCMWQTGHSVQRNLLVAPSAGRRVSTLNSSSSSTSTGRSHLTVMNAQRNLIGLGYIWSKIDTQHRSVEKHVGCFRRHLFVCGFVCQHDNFWDRKWGQVTTQLIRSLTHNWSWQQMFPPTKW